jgi:signal transduction histidine kinase
MNENAPGLVPVLELPPPEFAESLARYARRIRSDWRRNLSRLGLRPREINLLSRLRFAGIFQPSGPGTPQPNWSDVLLEGEHLARRGVPPEKAAVAIGLLVGSALSSLHLDDPQIARGVASASGLTSLYLFFLLSGYTRYDQRRRTAEPRLVNSSAQLSEAYERQRRRLAQDLHDVIGHDLLVLRLYTEMFARNLEKASLPRLRQQLRQISKLLQHASNTVRRLTLDLGPVAWSGLGFVPSSPSAPESGSGFKSGTW